MEIGAEIFLSFKAYVSAHNKQGNNGIPFINMTQKQSKTEIEQWKHQNRWL